MDDISQAQPSNGLQTSQIASMGPNHHPLYANAKEHIEAGSKQLDIFLYWDKPLMRSCANDVMRSGAISSNKYAKTG